jgi:hypothetical protein
VDQIQRTQSPQRRLRQGASPERAEGPMIITTSGIRYDTRRARVAGRQAGRDEDP